MDVPKKLQRAIKKLGEAPVLVCPALLQRYSTQRMIAMARIGAMEESKIFSWLVATATQIHFVRPGLLWDKVQSVLLDKITDVEYVDEFHSNTLKLIVEGAAENIIFYDDMDGIRFFQYVKNRIKPK
jgi:hypothetical protein